MFKFESNVKDHKKLIREAAIKALTAGTLVAEDNAVQLAPVAEVFGGTLKQSIGHEIDEKDLEGTVGATVDYAPYQEFGTFKMAAQPFIRPGLQDKNVKQAVENEMRKAVDDD